MLYFVFRFVPIFIISLIIIVILKVNEKKKKDKRRIITSKKVICIAILFLYLVLCIPFENVYSSFKTPADAYKYQNLNDILFTVENEENALIVIKNGSQTSCALYYKQDGGWKLNWPYSFEQNDVVISGSNSGAIFFIVRYKVNDGNHNHVLIVWSPFEDNAKLELSDSINSSFQEVYTDDSTKYMHSYVENIDESYRVFINGESYVLE